MAGRESPANRHCWRPRIAATELTLLRRKRPPQRCQVLKSVGCSLDSRPQPGARPALFSHVGLRAAIPLARSGLGARLSRSALRPMGMHDCAMGLPLTFFYSGFFMSACLTVSSFSLISFCSLRATMVSTRFSISPLGAPFSSSKFF